MLLSQQLGLFIVLVTGVLLRCAALAIAHNHVLWNCHLSSRLLSLLTHVTLVVITYMLDLEVGWTADGVVGTPRVLSISSSFHVATCSVNSDFWIPRLAQKACKSKNV